MRTHDKDTNDQKSWGRTHPLASEDAQVIAALRTMVEPNKGKLQGTAARVPFDGIMSRVSAPENVTFEQGDVGDITGWWCFPSNARTEEAILHLHGGWYNWGTALAYRNLVGHIAQRAGVNAFIPDYRLAPEHPFPAALQDAQACYRGLIEQGTKRVALVGDSAGGGLALVLSALTKDEITPVGVVALSPVTDLSLTGTSMETRADSDPYFTRAQITGLIQAYLNNHDSADPLASPLYGNLAGLPPVRIHVGDEEVLLDDSLRYGERAIAAGVDAKVDVWMGMPHGFTSGVGTLSAANQALDLIGDFLREKFMIKK